ncbi:hydroxypyruvate isomerase family protein [Streptomyces sp. NPDC001177]
MTMTPGHSGRYALNVSMVLASVPLTDRVLTAAEGGFPSVEMWWPFTCPRPGEQEVAELRTSLAGRSRLVCLNIDAGDVTAGDRGLLSDPGREDRCRESIVTAVEFAAATGCRLLNLPYGKRVRAHSEAAQHRTAFANLLFAARQAHDSGISVLLEPLNTLDNPGFLLSDVEWAARLVRRAKAAGADNTGILLDVYHLARMRRNVPEAIERYAGDILHVQFADLPGRACPGSGALDFVRVVDCLDKAGYRGHIGLEFSPGPDVDAALSAARAFVSSCIR